MVSSVLTGFPFHACSVQLVRLLGPVHSHPPHKRLQRFHEGRLGFRDFCFELPVRELTRDSATISRFWRLISTLLGIFHLWRLHT